MNTTHLGLLLGGTPGREDDAAGARVVDPWRRHRRRVLVRWLLIATAVVIVMACVLGVSVVRASRHYDRGRQAYAAGQYERAAAEFAAARVLMIGFRNADWLNRAAQEQAAARPTDSMIAPLVWPLQYRILLGRALRSLRDGKYLSASAAIGELRRTYATCPLDLGRHGSRAAALGAERLLALAGERFRDGRWSAVRPYADAALVLQPDWAQALELGRRAHVFSSVAPLFARGQALADQGAWDRAARVLRSVVAVAPGYPGAAHLLATASAKIAAKEAQSRQGAPDSPAASPAPTPTPTPAPTRTLPPPP